jgi:tetratricopeptide (TPR) repeat protein
LKKIHPVRLYKGRELYFSIKLLNSEKEKIYTFENGTILITTQLIANLSEEKDLFEKMVQSVVHIIYDHSYKSMDPFSEDPQRQLGIIYSSELIKKGKQIAEEYMKLHIQNQNQIHKFHNNQYFIDRIANVVSYTAWQEYYSQHYMKSLRLLNKVIDAGFGTEEDYLLKAKLYRILGSGDDALKEAIHSIRIAESFGNQKLTDIYSEKGILLMKINKWDEALEAFKKYNELIMNQPGSEMEMKWCVQMMHKCRRQIKTNTGVSVVTD